MKRLREINSLVGLLFGRKRYGVSSGKKISSVRNCKGLLISRDSFSRYEDEKGFILKVIQRACLHFLISIIVMGCASSSKMRPEANPNIVVLQSYPVSYDTAFKKVLQTLDFKNMSIKEASKERHFIIAKSGLKVGFGEGGWGNLIGIYFKERSPLVTEISIAQENWSKLQMIETDETYDLLSLFKNTLKE